MRDLCAECGADLSNEKQNANVPMVHSVPELKVSLEVSASFLFSLILYRFLMIIYSQYIFPICNIHNMDTNPHVLLENDEYIAYT
jgi:hypothetical protein